MTGCPSREQLVNLVGDRTIEIEGFDLGEHMRLCAHCRAVLKSLSQDGTTDSGNGRPERGAVLTPAPLQVDDDDPKTLADFGQTIDTFAGGAKMPSSADMASHASEILSSSDTIDTAVRGPGVDRSMDTIDTAFRASGPRSSMETIDSAFDIQSRPLERAHAGPVSGLSSDASAQTQHATYDASGVTSEATLEFSRESGVVPRRTAPSVLPPASLGGKRGPADYEILGELGRGGMGIVYKARHLRLNRVVALKMIRGGVHADDIQVTRFRIEAEAVAALRHPNILQIYEIGESDGLPYVALELLEGGSLADKLHGTPLPPRKAAEWMVPMAMAMDTAHKAGIVHRDLKSVNILFTADSVPKVTDFGLAKRLEVDEGHTHTGQVMGTPSYMAPEQARGDTKNVGPAADIYALGAILYEMLTGRPPFKGVSAMDTVKQVIEVEPVAPSRVQYKVPHDLETICLKCLQKEARKRYPTAKDMADDLNRYLVGEPIKARRTPPAERAWKWTKRHPTVALASACAIAGVVSLLGYGGWYWNHQRELERTALAHESQLKTETADDLLRAQESISKNDLNRGHERLSKRIALLDLERRKGPELTDLYDRTKAKLDEIDQALQSVEQRQAEQRAKDEVQARYRHFLDRRKEAIFRDTQFSGVVQSSNLDLTRQSAEDALAVFGTTGTEHLWALGELPASLTPDQQADIKEGCYELLLVLAGATAALGPEKVDGALQVLDSADRLRPGHSRAYYLNKAACLAAKKDKSAEAQALAEAQRLRPETPFDYFLTGQQEYKEKRYADAIQDFDRALRQKPDHFWAKCLHAICAIQMSRYDGAKSSLTDCIEADRNFAWLYLLRGFASGQLGVRFQSVAATTPEGAAAQKKSADFQFNEADADFQQALERLKVSPDSDLEYTLLVNRGMIRFQRGEFDQAAADYQSAIALKKDRAEAHGELALVYESQGKHDQAALQFTQAIALKPKYSPFYRGRAKVLQASGDKDPARRAAALADLDKSIEYETQIKNAVVALDQTNRGLLLYQDGRYDDALAASRLALQVDPRFPDAHVLQVQSLLKLRRFDEVIRSCDAAIAMGKKSAVLYELRGLANFDRHDYPAAIRDFGEAIELRPNDATLLARRGWAYLVFDSARLALADFEAAIKIDPANGDVYAGRGTAHAMRGELTAAVADARDALSRAGKNPRVVYNAARIYAVAAAAPIRDAGEKGRTARQLSTRYEETALQLIRQAFGLESPEKRAAFWKETVQTDPALKAIRRRIKFEDLVVTNK